MHAFTVKGCVFLSTKLCTDALIPISSTCDQIYWNDWRWPEWTTLRRVTADCESSPSHDQLLRGNRGLYFNLTDKPWSELICWISLVWSTGKNPLYTEYWSPVEDMTEQQGDQRVTENSKEGHKFDPWANVTVKYRAFKCLVSFDWT